MRVNSHILSGAIGAMICALLVGHAAAQWIERPLVEEPNLPLLPLVYTNVNLMLDPSGKLIVGGNLRMGTGYGLPVLASLTPGDLLFEQYGIYEPLARTSFALDPDGMVMFTGQFGAPAADIYFGQDLGDAGGLRYGSREIYPLVNASTIAINHQGIPTVAWSSNISGSYGYYSQTFDPASGDWGQTVLAIADETGPTTLAPSLAFDAQDLLLIGGIVNAPSGYGSAQLMRTDPVNGAQELLYQATDAYRSAGTALAVGADGQIAFAYQNQYRQPVVALIDNEQITVHTLDIPQFTSTPYWLLADSIAFDADGLPALVISQQNRNALLVRMNSSGTWNTEPLPVLGLTGSIIFDDANNPYIGIITDEGITLLSPNLPPLLRGDFNVNGIADENDLADFDLAIHDRYHYYDAHPGLIEPELLLIGDYNDDGLVDRYDAYTMADNLPVEHLGSLITRSAGYFALDQAHAGGNFFSTTLATGKTYADGDARGDLNPLPDQLIDDADIDYLFDQWYLASPDLRCDLNNDGIVGALDATILVKVILGTHFGDANLDGIVNLADLQILGDNWHSTTASWAKADFNGDGMVNLADLQVLGDNWQATMAGDFAQLAAMYVPEPAALSVLLTACLLVLPKRRTRC